MATAVALALGVLSGCDGRGNKELLGDHHPTVAEVESIYSEAYRVAPLASSWCGYRIPFEAAWVLAQKEDNQHCLGRHCAPDSLGAANDRSTGYFAMTVPAIRRFSTMSRGVLGVEVSIPNEKAYGSEDEWKRAVCRWAKSHPVGQVRCLFVLLAYYTRREHGDWTASCESISTTTPREQKDTCLRSNRYGRADGNGPAKEC